MVSPTLILFDCDGVLIDSEVICGVVFAEMLTKIGLPHTAEEATQRFLGLSGATATAIIEKDLGAPVPSWFKEETTARLAAAYAQELKEIPGISGLLKKLTTPVCVASSSSVKRLQVSLTHVGLYDHFAPNIFSAEMVAHGKPKPDIFLYAARRMGFAPENCIVIEDSINGVLAARAAQMTCIGFTGGSHCGTDHASRLRDAGAAEIATDMTELKTLLSARGL